MLELSQTAKDFKMGTYRHFKGTLVEVLYIARDSADEMKEVVVYRHLEDGLVWVRELGNFLELVVKADFSGPRFLFIK